MLPTFQSLLSVDRTKTILLIASPFLDLFNVSFQLYDTVTSTEDSEVKFKVSRDTLGAMLRSMAYIREQISSAVHVHTPLLISVKFVIFTI